MPSMTSERAAAFDQAFAPLPDRKVDALDALFRTMESVNIVDGWAELALDTSGLTYTVGPNRCEKCGTWGEGDCVHKAITRKVVAEARALNEMDYQEYAEEHAEQRMAAMGRPTH